MESTALTVAPKLTQAALARELSVSRQAVNDLVRRGVLSIDQDGKIDLESARVAIANGVHPSAKTSAALQSTAPNQTNAANVTTATNPAAEDAAITSYHIAKTLREATEARRAQIALARERGEVIQVSAVRAALANAYATMREAILNLPARLAPKLAAESDPAAIQNLLHAELHSAVTALASTHVKFSDAASIMETNE